MHCTLRGTSRRWPQDIRLRTPTAGPGSPRSPIGFRIALTLEKTELSRARALKRSYRDLINRAGSGLIFVFLAGSKETIAARLAAHHGHFMRSSMLDSQFADLEEPAADEPAIRVDIGLPAAEIAEQVIEDLGLAGRA